MAGIFPLLRFVALILVYGGVISMSAGVEAKFHDVRMHLNHGVVFKQRGIIRNSQESCTYSFLVKKFLIPENIFAPSMPCSLEVRENDFNSDTYRSLVQNACRKLKSMYGQYLRQRDEIVKGMKEKMEEAWKLLPDELPENFRGRRAPFSFVASVAKFLFGTPTGGDIKLVNEQINFLAQKIDEQDDILTVLGNHVRTVTNVTNARLTDIEIRRQSTDSRFDELVRDLQTWRRELKLSVHDFQFSSVQLAKFVGFVGVLSQLTVADLMSLNYLEQQSTLYLNSLQTLAEGRLPSTMVDAHHLQKALSMISDELSKSSGQIISYPRLEYYYRHQLVVAAHQGDYILISLRVPVQPLSDTMILYNVLVFPLPHDSVNGTGNTFVKGIRPYLAVNLQGEYYAELEHSQVTECNENDCITSFPVSPRNHHSCVSALFYSDESHIMKLCHIVYQLNRHHHTSAVRVDENRLIILSPSPWLMNCRGGLPKEISPCKLCVLHLPCFCTVHSKKLTIMPSVGSCFNNMNNSAVILHPINKIVLNMFYRDSKEHKTPSTDLAVSPMNLSLPKMIKYSFDDKHENIEVPLVKLQNQMYGSGKRAVDVMEIMSRMNKTDVHRCWSDWSFVVIMVIVIVLMILIVFALIRLKFRINAVAMSLAAVSAINPAEAKPMLKNHFVTVANQARVTVWRYDWDSVYLIVAIAVMIAACCLLFKQCRTCLKSRGIISNFEVSCAVSTVVIVLENEMDRVILPIQEYHLPPNVFYLRDAKPRSVQMQTSCCTAHLIVDWGENLGMLYHLKAPLAIPAIIMIPLRRTRRVSNIVNRPHRTYIRIFYDDIVCTIQPFEPDRIEDNP